MAAFFEGEYNTKGQLSPSEQKRLEDELNAMIDQTATPMDEETDGKDNGFDFEAFLGAASALTDDSNDNTKPDQSIDDKKRKLSSSSDFNVTKQAKVEEKGYTQNQQQSGQQGPLFGYQDFDVEKTLQTMSDLASGAPSSGSGENSTAKAANTRNTQETKSQNCTEKASSSSSSSNILSKEVESIVGGTKEDETTNGDAKPEGTDYPGPKQKTQEDHHTQKQLEAKSEATVQKGHETIASTARGEAAAVDLMGPETKPAEKQSRVPMEKKTENAGVLPTAGGQQEASTKQGVANDGSAGNENGEMMVETGDSAKSIAPSAKPSPAPRDQTTTINQDTVRQLKKELISRHSLMTTYNALKQSFTHVCGQLKDVRAKYTESKKNYESLASENAKLKRDLESRLAQINSLEQQLKQRN